MIYRVLDIGDPGHIHRIWRIYLQFQLRRCTDERIRRVWRNWRRRSIIRRLEDSAFAEGTEFPAEVSFTHLLYLLDWSITITITHPLLQNVVVHRNCPREENGSRSIWKTRWICFRHRDAYQEIVHRPHINVKRLTISIDV